jgi:hypothetical protein
MLQYCVLSNNKKISYCILESLLTLKVTFSNLRESFKVLDLVVYSYYYPAHLLDKDKNYASVQHL